MDTASSSRQSVAAATLGGPVAGRDEVVTG